MEPNPVPISLSHWVISVITCYQVITLITLGKLLNLSVCTCVKAGGCCSVAK